MKLDLTDPKFVPGKPCYEKAKSALKSLERFTVIVTWDPPEETVCPSSVAKFFDGIGCKVQLCEPTLKSHVVYSVKTPTLDKTNVKESDIVDFVEWLGMVSVDGDFTEDVDTFLNTYESPEPNIELGQIRVLVWRGFYQTDQVMKLARFLNEYNNAADKIWVSMYVQGFSDTPVIENNDEQNYFTNGDNANVCIFKKSKFWYCKQRCSAKMYK